MSASSSAPLLAEFETPDALVRALRLVRGDGHRPLDAYTPFPLEELSGALPPARNPVRFVMAVAGFGAAAAMWGATMGGRHRDQGTVYGGWLWRR